MPTFRIRVLVSGCAWLPALIESRPNSSPSSVGAAIRLTDTAYISMTAFNVWDSMQVVTYIKVGAAVGKSYFSPSATPHSARSTTARTSPRSLINYN